MQKEEEKIEEIKSGGMLKKLLFGVLAVIILLGVGSGITYYLAKNKPGMIGLPKSTSEQQAEADAIVASVGKLITLPTGETPTIATITDVSKLQDQPFFKNAKNGDKILVYQNANKAIIYRPGENRIIDVGAVNVINPTPQASTSASPKATPAVSPTPKSTAQ